ncbi:hypothetical protein B0H13DRAFT_1615776, partial [Mycena leptocephala]
KICVHCHVTSTSLWRREPSTQEGAVQRMRPLQQCNLPRPHELIDTDIDDTESLRIPDADYYNTAPKCSHRLTRQTSVWRRSKARELVCNACGLYIRLRRKERPLSLKRNKIKSRTKSPK